MKRRGYIAGLLHASLLLVACCALLVAAASCGTAVDVPIVPTPTTEVGHSAASDNTPTPTATAEVGDDGAVASDAIVPTPTPEVQVQAHRPASFVVFDVPASLEEQIYYSDVIVRATLKSATSTTETVDSGASATYRPVHELRFIIHEYLKGSGPSEAVVVAARGDEYATVAEAHKKADWAMTHRNTTWDSRQGVLFMVKLPSSYNPASAASAATTTAFGLLRGSMGESLPWWGHTVDTLSRGWLPAGDATGGVSSDGGASGAASVSFIEDGSKSPYPTVTLGQLRTKISEMVATLKAGEGIDGYDECIRRKIYRERLNRARPWTPLQDTVSMPSGSATGTEVFRDRKSAGEPKYIRYYVTGPDKDYFQSPNIDDDSDPSNGYFRTLSNTRPLPAGSYAIKRHQWHYSYFPCNYKAGDSNYDEWTVTVTAPPGTVHEAFFDPASTFLGVGASGGAGVISPASFNVGGATTTITRIIVSFGSMVSMQISPSVSLSGKHVEFIKVDGTVAARLSFDAGDLKGGIGIGGAGSDTGTSTAAVSEEAQAEIAAAMSEAQATGSKMYFWFVSSAPWQAGDKLMLRIR